MHVPGSSYEFCVLIPCYNNLSGLIESLQSITYNKGSVCVLIVDDGSDKPFTDKDLPEEVNLKFFIIILRLAVNTGITNALNTGLQWIIKQLKTEYIARLDCGDICSENRFHLQVNFLNAHPDVGLLGTWCTFEKIASSAKYKYTTPVEHNKILKEMCFRNVFIHPTVIFRTDLVKKIGYYPSNYPHAEDYALFWSMLKVSKGAVLSQFLVKCEISINGISHKNRKEQLISRKK